MKNQHQMLLIAAAFGLGLLSAASVPLRYDHGNSGRYLLPVLQATDGTLFPNDLVVESLKRFRSLVYDALGAVAKHSDLSPDGLESLFSWLYVASRILIVLAVMRLAIALDRDSLTALFAGIWSCFTSSVPVGGDSLFVNVVTHGTVSLLLGAASIWLLMEQRRLAGWVLLALNLFVHPLMTLHLALCIVPAYLLLRRQIARASS